MPEPRVIQYIITRDQVGWLGTLVASHKELMAGRSDPDPTATWEMYHAVQAAVDALNAALDAATPPELPTDAEVEAMYQAAHGDPIPF